MKNALGHLAIALMFARIWLQLIGQALAPQRDLATVVLLLVLVVAHCLAVAGLSALLRPLGRALLDALSLRLLQARRQRTAPAA